MVEYVRGTVENSHRRRFGAGSPDIDTIADEIRDNFGKIESNSGQLDRTICPPYTTGPAGFGCNVTERARSRCRTERG